MDMTYGFNFNFVDYITKFGQVNPELLWYHNWPGMPLIQSLLMNVTGVVNLDFLALFGSFIIQIILILPLYVFFQHVLNKDNHRWVALWVFYLGNWTAQIYLSPQALGLIWLLCLLSIIVKRVLTRSSGDVSLADRISIVLLTCALAITHILTSLAGFLGLMIVWIVRRNRSFYLVMLAAMIIIIWTLYGASVQLNWQLPNYIERAFRLDLLFQRHFIDSTMTASASHSAINQIRILFSGLFVVIGGLGVLLVLKFKSKADLIMLALTSIPILLSVTGLYGWEMLMRAYLLALIPIGYFAVKLLNTRVTFMILCLVMLAAAPLHVITYYGNAAQNHIPRGEISYWHFIQDNTETGYLINGLRPMYATYEGYSNIDLDIIEWDNQVLTGTALKDQKPQYVNIGIYESSIREFVASDSELISYTGEELAASKSYNLIYANQDVNLFIHESASTSP
ncbi:MAG: hypothetical protein JW762_13605 [Dehalococcoidales bacterium]|nr:hypothetical protein [Dehalococcoidales bacterium]